MILKYEIRCFFEIWFLGQKFGIYQLVKSGDETNNHVTMSHADMFRYCLSDTDTQKLYPETFFQYLLHAYFIVKSKQNTQRKVKRQKSL